MSLFALFVDSMGMARAAVLFELELAGSLLFIFRRIIIFALTLRTRQYDDISHDLRPTITPLFH